MGNRLNIDQWAMALVQTTALRSTCLHRQIGCILTNKKGHVLATGYNGAATGLVHCSDTGHCHKARFTSGEGLDHCVAIHAEQNALLQCHNVNEIHAVYCTASPCTTCTKLLLNTSAQIIMFYDRYPHPEAEAMWTMSGRIWRQVTMKERTNRVILHV